MLHILHCPLSRPDLTYISLLFIFCITEYVTHKRNLNLERHGKHSFYILRVWFGLAAELRTLVWCLLTNGCLAAGQDNRWASHYMNIHEYSTFKIRFNLQRWINIVNLNKHRKKTKGSPFEGSHKKSDKHPWWLSDEYFVICFITSASYGHWNRASRMS